MPLRTIIIEDDLLASRILQRHCEHNDDIQLISSFTNSEDAMDFLTMNDIDLIFLDIELPGISGLQFLENSPYLPQVIFATGNTEYAFDAFEHEATDFLKKPISYSKFELAVSKAVKKSTEKRPIQQEGKKVDYIFVKADGRLKRIELKNILFIENVGDYVKIVTENGNYITYNTLKAVDSKLGQFNFFKVHRSYIINLDKVSDVEENALTIQQNVIPISRANRSALMDRLNLL